jgi:hypothetical protein
MVQSHDDKQKIFKCENTITIMFDDEITLSEVLINLMIILFITIAITLGAVVLGGGKLDIWGL